MNDMPTVVVAPDDDSDQLRPPRPENMQKLKKEEAAPKEISREKERTDDDQHRPPSIHCLAPAQATSRQVPAKTICLEITTGYNRKIAP